MQSKNLFIDTSIFRQKNFDFTNSMLQTLKKLAIDNKIKLFTTQFTIFEIKKKINDF